MPTNPKSCGCKKHPVVQYKGDIKKDEKDTKSKKLQIIRNKS